MKISSKTNILLCIGIIVSYLVNETIRLFFNSILDINYQFLNQINVVALIFIIIYFISTLKNSKIYLHRFLIYFIMIIAALVSFYMSNDISRSGLAAVVTILPLFFLCYSGNSIKIDSARILEILRIVLFIITLSILLFGIIDYFSNLRITKLMISFLSLRDNSKNSLLNTLLAYWNAHLFRLNSFWGQSLTTTKYFLTSLLIYFLTTKLNKRPFFDVIMILITFLGIIMSASKSGFVLVILMFAIRYGNIKNIKYIILVSIVMIVLIYTNIFENLIGYRFSAPDITSGRSTLTDALFSGSIEKPGLLWGHGSGYAGYLISIRYQLKGNFEYPFLIFAYDYGLLFAVLFEILVFSTVSLYIKRRQFKYACFLTLYIIYMNVFNGLASMGDAPLQLCLLLLLIQANVYKEKEEGSYENLPGSARITVI